MTNIPSDEEFARAEERDREAFRNVDRVCRNVEKQFRNKCPLHRVFILPQIDVNFRAYVFFKNDSDIDACVKDGTIFKIRDRIRVELERARGKKEAVTIAFEFDSDENVTRLFEGDYNSRLH